MDMLNLKALAGTLSPKDVDELDVWLVASAKAKDMSQWQPSP